MYFEPLAFLLWITGCVAVVATALFFIGRAYESSKRPELKNELKRLRKQNETMKRLAPKLKWGEDVKFKRPKRLHSPKKKLDSPPPQGGSGVPKAKRFLKLEIINQGHPDDA